MKKGAKKTHRYSQEWGEEDEYDDKVCEMICESNAKGIATAWLGPSMHVTARQDESSVGIRHPSGVLHTTRAVLYLGGGHLNPRKTKLF